MFQKNPMLLIIYNHWSHKPSEAIDFAKEEEIVCLTLYPYASHKMQPVDVSAFCSI